MYINAHFAPIFFLAGGVNAWAGVLFQIILTLSSASGFNFINTEFQIPVWTGSYILANQELECVNQGHIYVSVLEDCQDTNSEPNSISPEI